MFVSPSTCFYEKNVLDEKIDVVVIFLLAGFDWWP
jgi:hypothetical protein